MRQSRLTLATVAKARRLRLEAISNCRGVSDNRLRELHALFPKEDPAEKWGELRAPRPLKNRGVRVQLRQVANLHPDRRKKAVSSCDRQTPRPICLRVPHAAIPCFQRLSASDDRRWTAHPCQGQPILSISHRHDRRAVPHRSRSCSYVLVEIALLNGWRDNLFRGGLPPQRSSSASFRQASQRCKLGARLKSIGRLWRP
jgi:hypothetical protein